MDRLLGLLDQAARELSQAGDPEDALFRMARHALPALGTWCILDVIDEDGTMRRPAIVHAEAGRDRVADRLLRDWPPQPGDPFGAGRAIESPRPGIVARVPDSMLRHVARSAEVERQLRELGMGSLLFLPLVSSDLLLGSMTFVSPGTDAYTPEDLLLGEDLAKIAALALDNARLRRSAADSKGAADAARAENRELNRRLEEAREQLLVPAVREQQDVTPASPGEGETGALFRITFERAAMGIAVLDDEGQVVATNPALREMLGTSAAALRGVRLCDLSPEETAATEWELFESLVAGERERYQIEKEIRRGDGSALTANEVMSMGRRDDGPDFAIAIIEDITGRKRVEEKRRHSQRMEAAGRLAGGVAHDFNNILMALGGCSEVILADFDEDHPLRADLEEIQKIVDRAARLTHQLLAFSREQVLQPGALRTDGLLDEMKQMLERPSEFPAATDTPGEPARRRAPAESAGGTTTSAPPESRAAVDANAAPARGTADEARAADRGDEAGSTDPGPEEEASPPIILVVDDEDAIRALLTRVLEGSGFRVLTARGSHEALEVLQAGGVPVDLVVTDVIMPDMSGAELARQLRGRNPELRMLFISGHHEAILDPDEWRDGTDFLTKPFTTDDLVRAVQELLR